MPGHKRNKNFIGQDLLNLDMTEIDGLDNLHNPNGIIKDAQENCAKIFGCYESFFVVNGASSAVMSAIFSICNENDEIIAMRNSHKVFIMHWNFPVFARIIYTEKFLECNKL